MVVVVDMQRECAEEALLAVAYTHAGDIEESSDHTACTDQPADQPKRLVCGGGGGIG